MSGVQNLHADWKEKLSDLKANLPNNYGDESGGFVSNSRSHRRNSSSTKRIDPFGEEIEVAVKRRDRSGKSKDSRGAESLFHNPEDTGGNATENAIGDEEVNIMSQSSDQLSDDENHDESNLSSQHRSKRSTSRYNKAEGEHHQEEHEPTPEELEKDRRREEVNQRFNNTAKLGGLLLGAIAVLAGAAAVGAGLFGKHKSNIMNM